MADETGNDIEVLGVQAQKSLGRFQYNLSTLKHKFRLLASVLQYPLEVFQIGKATSNENGTIELDILDLKVTVELQPVFENFDLNGQCLIYLRIPEADDSTLMGSFELSASGLIKLSNGLEFQLTVGDYVTEENTWQYTLILCDVISAIFKKAEI